MPAAEHAARCLGIDLDQWRLITTLADEVIERGLPDPEAGDLLVLTNLSFTIASIRPRGVPVSGNQSSVHASSSSIARGWISHTTPFSSQPQEVVVTGSVQFEGHGRDAMGEDEQRMMPVIRPDIEK